MNISLRKKQGINLLLKCNAVLIGYLLWLMFGSTLVTRMWLKVPICFYNVQNHLEVDAPETVRIQVAGKRFHFRNLDVSQLAIHLDAQQLPEGEHVIKVDQEHLFLPDQIKVINWVPLNPIVTVRKKS